MPGVLPIFIAFVVVVAVCWLAAWWHTRNPAHRDPREDFRQLQRHAAWLEQRLDIARRERWSSDMITSLSNQLGIACQQLARTRGGVLERKTDRVR